MDARSSTRLSLPLVVGASMITCLEVAKQPSCN